MWKNYSKWNFVFHLVLLKPKMLLLHMGESFSSETAYWFFHTWINYIVLNYYYNEIQQNMDNHLSKVYILTHLLPNVLLRDCCRTMEAGLLLTRPPRHIGRFKMVRHPKSWGGENRWVLSFCSKYAFWPAISGIILHSYIQIYNQMYYFWYISVLIFRCMLSRVILMVGHSPRWYIHWSHDSYMRIWNFTSITFMSKILPPVQLSC